MVKGALVEFTSAFGASVPNVVMFQFNPETLRHSWSHSRGEAEPAGANPFGVTGMPNETFSFSLVMDVAQQLEDSDASVRSEAEGSGIYNRLAALELLLFPKDKSDDGLLSPLTDAAGGESRPTPAAQVPAVLFVWGVGRILPVRVTSLTITEKLYDRNLNPIYADANVELRVLTPTELASVDEPLRTVAIGAYEYSLIQRQERAMANLGDSARAVIGMLENTL